MDLDNPEEYFLSISKENLAKLPAAKFNGRIVVVDTENQVEEAIQIIRQTDIIGFDTETRPTFRKGALNEVSLLQLSTIDTCFLFRINRIGFHKELVQFLEDENSLKVGLSIHDDFHNLQRIKPFEPKGFIDLQQYVKTFHIADNSLSRIYAIIFNERISKGQRLSNWEAETLSASQMNYASLDAVACIQIYHYLSSGNFNPLTSPYLQFHEK